MKRVIPMCMPLFTSSVYVHILTFRLNPILTSKALLIEEFSTLLFNLCSFFFKSVELGVRGDWQSALFLVNISFYWVGMGKFFFPFFYYCIWDFISFILIDGKKMNKSRDLFFRAYLIESETFYPSIYCLEKPNQTNIIWFGLLRLC